MLRSAPCGLSQPVEAAEGACVSPVRIDVPEFGGDAVRNQASKTGMTEESANEAGGVPVIGAPVVDHR